MARVAESLSSRITWRSMRAACRLAVRRIDLKVEGLDHLPAAGAVLLVARHFHHFWDGCALVALSPRPLHLVVALDWVRHPVLDRLLRRACRLAGWPVLVRPERPQREGEPAASSRLTADLPALLAATRATVALLRDGQPVLVFPEGYPTIDPSYTPKAAEEEVLPFRPGFVRFAAIASRDGHPPVPIVPVGLEYQRGARWRLTVRFGPPATLNAGIAVDQQVHAIEQEVRRLSGLRRAT